MSASLTDPLRVSPQIEPEPRRHHREIVRNCRRIKDGAAAAGEKNRLTDQPVPGVPRRLEHSTSRDHVIPNARRSEEGREPLAYGKGRAGITDRPGSALRM